MSVTYDRAEDYNKQKALSEQQHCIRQEHLLSLGRILIEHGMHQDFGISLLHRHTTINSGDVMVHFMREESGMQVDRCRPVELELHDISPFQYYLNDDDELVPYEFTAETSTTKIVSHDFVKNFAGLLDDLDLRRNIGISRRRLNGPWYECEAEHNSCTVATQQVPLMHAGSVVTQWGFELTETGIRVIPEMICVEGQGKVHWLVPKPEDNAVVCC